MTNTQTIAAINYMINHAEESPAPNGDTVKLIYNILIRVMPQEVVTAAIREATAQEV